MLNKISGVRISSIASYLPPNKVYAKDYIPLFGEKKIKELVNGSGVESHYVASDGMTSVDMSYLAAEHLLNAGDIDRSKIDGLIFVTNSPDYIMPSSAYIIQAKLGLSIDAFCVQTANGCPGFIYGMAEAASLIAAKTCKRILLLCGETNSRFFSKNNYLKIVFGDAASAVLIEEGDSEVCFSIHADGRHYKDVIIEAGGYRFPISAETCREIIDEDGNHITKQDMIEDGMAFMQQNILNMPRAFNEVLSYQNWGKEELNLVAMQQTNKFMLDIMKKKYGVDSSICPSNIKECGNVGPASIPLLISMYLGGKDTSLIQKCICTSMGVGIGWGAMTCDLSKTNISLHLPD